MQPAADASTESVCSPPAPATVNADGDTVKLQALPSCTISMCESLISTVVDRAEDVPLAATRYATEPLP